MPRSTAEAVYYRFKNNLTYGSIEKRVRKRVLSERDLRLLSSFVGNYCFASLQTIAIQFTCNTGILISVYSIRRCIHRLDIQSRKAVSKYFLKPGNIRARVLWARSYSNWDETKWASVAFSDESSFAVRPSPKNVRFWRKKVDRYMPSI